MMTTSIGCYYSNIGYFALVTWKKTTAIQGFGQLNMFGQLIIKNQFKPVEELL